MRPGPRGWVVLVALAACGAEVPDDPGTQVDGPVGDAPPSDAPADARPCTGGDASTTAPDGSCLVFFGMPRTYGDAQAQCQLAGARLAILKTAEVDTVAEALVGTADTWIGLDDRATEGTFRWIDGSDLGFANWHLAEPNDGGGQYPEDCAIIAGARVGKQWDDRPCEPIPMIGGGLYAVLCQF